MLSLPGSWDGSHPPLKCASKVGPGIHLAVVSTVDLSSEDSLVEEAKEVEGEIHGPSNR